MTATPDVMEARTLICGIGDLDLATGARLEGAALACQTYGRLAADGRNGILLAHGYTSSAHAAGRDPASGMAGWWAELVGPGRPIDTDEYFVVSSNMLGSCYGSTGPTSINPATGRPYGPDFPLISTVDMVHAQRRMLDALGVKALVAVMGASFGGILSYQWGVTYPDFMRGIVPVVSAPRTPSSALDQVSGTIAEFWRDPDWAGGRYAPGALADTLRRVWYDTVKLYGGEALVHARLSDPAQREATLRAMAETGTGFDPNAFIALGLAASRFDVTPELGKIRAKVLHMMSRTDVVFPSRLAPGISAMLMRAGVEAAYHEIDSDFGHLAFRENQDLLAGPIRAFLKSL